MWYRYSQQLQLPEIDVEQNPVKEKPKTEKQPKQELLETQKPTPSLFFSDWSKDHYVPGMPVYHGTTHEFDQFDINKGTASNVFGPGFYFTSDQEDANQNYTGTGPDQKINIENLEYRLSQEDDDDEYYLWNLYGDDPRYSRDFNEDGRPYNPNYLIAKIAKDIVLGPNKPRVIPAHVRMKSPLHLTSENDTEHPERTFIDDTNESLDFLYDNDVDESDNNSYKTAIFKLYNILIDYFESETAYEICEDLIQYTTGSVDGKSSATIMMDKLKGILEFHDQDQDVNFKGEIFQRFVNSLGHDSIIMDPNQFFRMYSDKKPTKHYITWNPENIKHARENIEFDPRNPVITAGKKKANYMWYTRLKTAISKQSAEDIIQSELRSGTYVDPATEDANVIKSKLIEKYGSEEAMVQAINEAIVQMSHKLTGSSMADPSSETTSYFQNQGGIDAFYVMPDGTQTPNLRSHVMFDKFLVHKLGIDPSALTDRSDRHVLSELTGAMRVNVSGGKVNVTIYTPPTPAQQKWMKNNDISKDELDIRRDSMEKPQVDTNQVASQLIEQGKALSDIAFTLEQSINELVVTRVNPKFSPATVGVEPYYITENPQGLNEELFEKLKDIKSQISYITDLANDLNGLGGN